MSLSRRIVLTTTTFVLGAVLLPHLTFAKTTKGHATSTKDTPKKSDVQLVIDNGALFPFTQTSDKTATASTTNSTSALTDNTATSSSQNQDPTSTPATNTTDSTNNSADSAQSDPMSATSSDVITDPNQNQSATASSTVPATTQNNTPSNPSTGTKVPATKPTTNNSQQTTAATPITSTISPTTAVQPANTGTNYYAGVAFSPIVTQILLTFATGTGVLGLLLVSGSVEWLAEAFTKRRPILTSKVPKKL